MFSNCDKCQCNLVTLPDTVTVTVTANNCGSLNLKRCSGLGATCGKCQANRCFCCGVKNVTGPNTCDIDQSTSECETGEFVLDRVGSCAWAYEPPTRHCLYNAGVSLTEPCKLVRLTATIKPYPSPPITANKCLIEVAAAQSGDENDNTCCGPGCACTISSFTQSTVQLPLACPSGNYSASAPGPNRQFGGCLAGFNWTVTI